MIQGILDKSLNSYSFINKVDIHNYNFLVGPHLVNNNHWNAFIVDMLNKKFYLIDPQKIQEQVLNKCFNNWLWFYNNRVDSVPCEWNLVNIDHPKQTDTYNCGVFVSYFIHNIVKHGCIKTDFSNFKLLRKAMAKTISSYK